MTINFTKYGQFPPVDIDRSWPSQIITKMPRLCSVDLRDGNQALINPMNHDRKLKLYNCLLSMGFKEIEVGFPASSQTDFNFVRYLIENHLIPEDVTIQVIVPARKELIDLTIKSLVGVPKAIIQLYNSTSKQQREQVFCKSRSEIIDLALNGVDWILNSIRNYPETDFILQYAPESFTATELDFALEICDLVSDKWLNATGKNLIINLPSTVELSTPNIFADQIEWMSDHLRHREKICLSIHPHNDRGTATAATELAILAGVDRVEGTLFGNGERTGNLDIINLALNCITQGIDAKLKLSKLPEIIKCVEECYEMKLSPRHPYAGDLVFTAFSGSHQDAIRKSLKLQINKDYWDVPYLPIDPRDIGRNYDEIIRINGQSGKGGLSYVLEYNYGFSLPRSILVYFQKYIQEKADYCNKELSKEQIFEAFKQVFFKVNGKLSFIDLKKNQSEDNCYSFNLILDNKMKIINGKGSDVLDAFINAINVNLCLGISITDHYQERNQITLNYNSYIIADFNGTILYGIGTSSEIDLATINAIISIFNSFYELNVESINI